MADVRAQIVAWANWGVANHAGFTYSEGNDRMEGVHKPGVTPCVCDCSAFVTYCYSWAGAADPNGQGYDGQGYTGTLLSHGTEISLAQVVPGDVIVYGPGTGDHTALIVQGGPDPLTVSMGEQGDPSFIHVSGDGRQPQRYLRFDTTQIMPSVTQPQGKPAVAQPQSNSQHIIVAGVSVAQVQAKVGVTADGVWGPITNGAVVKWQSAHGLQADGIVGPKTWWAMNAQNAPAQTPAPAHQSEPTIAQGATGGAVRLLQQRLGGIAVDGQFGPKTAEAVRAWQVNHHLSVDGVVGPQTWASLGV